MTIPLGLKSWERAMHASDKVRERLLRATAALRQAGVPYAVVGGNAVAVWVGQVDESAVRSTQDVDVLIRREDFEIARTALESVGFQYRQVSGITVFLDGPNAKVRDAVHLIFACEKVRPDYSLAAPDVTESRASEEFQFIDLEPLVRMKLTSFRDKDRTHLRDMLDVGLIDASWPSRLAAELGRRLQELIETPDG